MKFRLPVLQIDHRYSRRSAVQDKEFVFCHRERRWSLQFLWRRRRYGPESVPLKIKNENGAQMHARCVQAAFVRIDGQVLKA